MRTPDLGDRLVSAVVGVVFGAVVGFCLAWLLGVYSNTLGPGLVHVSAMSFAMAGAVCFGVLGLVLGPNVGTVIGNVFTAIYDFENGSIPGWLAFLVLVAVVAAVWWFLR